MLCIITKYPMLRHVPLFSRNLEKILERRTVSTERPCTATRPPSWALCTLDSYSRLVLSM